MRWLASVMKCLSLWKISWNLHSFPDQHSKLWRQHRALSWNNNFNVNSCCKKLKEKKRREKLCSSNKSDMKSWKFHCKASELMCHLRFFRFDVQWFLVIFNQAVNLCSGSNQTGKSDSVSLHPETEKPSEAISERVVQVNWFTPQLDSLPSGTTQLDVSNSHSFKITAANDLQLADVKKQHKL